MVVGCPHLISGDGTSFYSLLMVDWVMGLEAPCGYIFCCLCPAPKFKVAVKIGSLLSNCIVYINSCSKNGRLGS